jgi:hypothetical protein
LRGYPDAPFGCPQNKLKIRSLLIATSGLLHKIMNAEVTSSLGNEIGDLHPYLKVQSI